MSWHHAINLTALVDSIRAEAGRLSCNGSGCSGPCLRSRGGVNSASGAISVHTKLLRVARTEHGRAIVGLNGQLESRCAQVAMPEGRALDG